jgi:hypothetical protein
VIVGAATRPSWIQGLAAVVPLLVIAAAVALWWASDRIGQVGPFDKATFGWLFVVPIWAVSPAAAGFAWRGLEASARRRAAVVDGLFVGGIAGLALWLGVVTVDCQLGLARTPLEFMVPTAICGIATGAVFGFGLVAASAQAAAGHALRSVAVGVAVQLLLLAIIPTIAFIGFFGVCARP